MKDVSVNQDISELRRAIAELKEENELIKAQLMEKDLNGLKFSN